MYLKVKEGGRVVRGDVTTEEEVSWSDNIDCLEVGQNQGMWSWIKRGNPFMAVIRGRCGYSRKIEEMQFGWF